MSLGQDIAALVGERSHPREKTKLYQGLEPDGYRPKRSGPEAKRPRLGPKVTLDGVDRHASASPRL